MLATWTSKPWSGAVEGSWGRGWNRSMCKVPVRRSPHSRSTAASSGSGPQQ
ncbi:hypothetical protein [Streptomyces sp. NPDC019937]|uniref:hypothetical protein n=1 Tax=Streptomyces sp. NPDC019937 TaxID=3154787 RepID=UPI0033E94806